MSNESKEVPARVSLAAPKQKTVTVKLPVCGAEVQVSQRLGKHSSQATILADGDEGKYFIALMHILVTSNGQQFPMEEFEGMAGQDYDTIAAHLVGNSQSPKQI